MCTLKEKFNCYVYHIHLEGQDTSEGYVGVSKNPNSRYEHHRNRSENPHLRNAINLYKDYIIYDIILQGEESHCYEVEAALRPEKNIGWNINVGGSKPPSPKGTVHCIGKLKPDQRRKNYKHSEKTLIKLKTALSSERVRKLISDSKIGNKNPYYKCKGNFNPNFQGYYVTPDGVFESQQYVSKFYNISRNAVSRRFHSKEVIKPSRWQPKDYWGKTWRDIGWVFIGEKEMNYSELCEKIGWKLPRLYSFKDLEDIKFLVENLPNLEEGVVLYKEGEPTLKIKSSLYVVCHRLRGEGLNPKRIMQLIIMGEKDEYLSIFPEDTEHFGKYVDAYNIMLNEMVNTWDRVNGVIDQKEFALLIQHLPTSGVLFKARKNGENIGATYNSFDESFKLKCLANYVK